jgi:hypothetical protein
MRFDRKPSPSPRPVVVVDKPRLGIAVAMRLPSARFGVLIGSVESKRLERSILTDESDPVV